MLRAWMLACLFCTLCGGVVHCFNATACSVRFVALLCVAVLLYRNAMIFVYLGFEAIAAFRSVALSLL